MKPGDRLICIFVRPLAIGQQFRAWPLHITIVPWFRVRADTVALAGRLSDILRQIGPHTVEVGREAHFGYRKSKLVNLVDETGPLPRIEGLTRRMLHESQAWIADETTKRKRPFQPHVTVQAEGRLAEHDTITVDRLAVVEQKGDYKHVVGEVLL